MSDVSAQYLDLAGRSKHELAKVFAAGTAPMTDALTGYEFRGFNQPRAAALLGIRKFIKVFYTDRAGQPSGCNTPVRQNALGAEWIAKPSPANPKRYAFFLVEPPDPDAADTERRGAVLLDYSRGGNRGYDPARILRDYVVRVEPGSDDLLLGKAYFTLGGRHLAHAYFLIERHRPLTDAAALARRNTAYRANAPRTD
jgi:hypothetical protein